MQHRKIYLFTLIYLFLHFEAYTQQLATINGKITSSDGKPAPYITVKLDQHMTITNDKGLFEIKNVKSGAYMISASAIGIKTEEKAITVEYGKATTVDFVLNESSETLEEVIVFALENKYKVSLPSASLRLNETLLEAPQNIQTISNQVIKDQQIISLSDGLIRNVSGAIREEHWGDMYTSILMRGSQIQAMRNGFNFSASLWGPLTEDMSYVDHVEFVKGPAGFMIGNGDPSGLYNVVTKKPTGFNRAELTASVGSFNFYRTALDFDRQLTKDGKLLFRFNGAMQNKGSFRPNEKNDRYTVAPVISYQLTDKTKLTAEYTFQKAVMTEVGSFYAFHPDGFATLPRDFTLTQPGIQPARINDHTIFLNLQHNFSDNWKATAQVAYSKYLQTGTTSWPSTIMADGKIIRKVSIWDAESTMKLAQFFINGEIKTGGIKHRILAGFDGGRKEYFADWGQGHELDTPTDPFDSQNPDYGTPANGYPKFDRSLSVRARASKIGGLMNSKYISGYIQDELGFFDNIVRLTLAGRYSFVNQSAWGETADQARRITPRIGLSVSLNKNASIYSVYDQSFIPQSGLLRSGATPMPITGTNYEVGFKRDWLDGKWNTTLSVYKIRERNELANDPTNVAGENFSIVVGEMQSKGIEFDLRGEIATGLELIANYAYTDFKVTRVAEGVVHMQVGNVVPGFAKHTSNAWLSYSLHEGMLKGTGLFGGFTYLIDRATNNYSASNPEQNLPDYFKLDGGIFWQNNDLRITANVFNILDDYLYSGSYYPNSWNAPDYNQAVYSWQAEPPRNFRLSVTYKF